MLSWFIAALVGAAGAFAAYAGRRSTSSRYVVAAALRGLSVMLVVALALDAVVGAQRTPAPLVALDVSASWRRGRDSAAFDSARREAASTARDSLIVFGDSVRRGDAKAVPNDRASRIRPAAERAMAAGRPLVVYTDGEIDDPQSLQALPSGSRIVVRGRDTQRDAAVSDLSAPRVAAPGDSVDVHVTVVAGGGGAGRGTLQLELAGRRVASVAFDSLAAHGERTVTMRLVAPQGGSGANELRATVESAGDAESRNNASSSVIDLASAAAAVLVSSSPDLDSRELAALLRGTVSLPTRAYVRVAPGQWREDVTLAHVPEEVVRRAVRESPMVVLHGDTALFGDPRSSSRGALALVSPPDATQGEWFATGAPASPVSTALSGTPWDSLPPLDVAASMPPNAEFEILETRRARRLDRRVAIVGWERPRRIVVAGASGFWRWRFRGGAGTDAFTAVWGSLFDWLAGEHSDVRAAYPSAANVRAGDVIAWRRGATKDSVVRAIVSLRGGNRIDTLALRFGAENTSTESAGLPAGLYDVQTAGGASLLAVNPSSELLPRRPTVSDGALGTGSALGDAPHSRDFSWLFGLAVAGFCAEWLLRRRLGLR